MKKLAVVFYGNEYIDAQPLLYYPAKMMAEKGYEILKVSYGDARARAMEQKPNLVSGILQAAIECDNVLAEKKLQTYDRLVFISRGFGTVVANVCAGRQQVCPIQIMMSPPEQLFQFPGDFKGMVFCGTNGGTHYDYQKIERLCVERHIRIVAIEEGNHFLETNDTLLDMENLRKILIQFHAFLEGLDHSVYDFKVLDMDNEPQPLSEYEGKVLLIVNTATGCGFTPQYAFLEDMYRKYKKEGFEILDFPCNQFMNQAPGSAKEINNFCISRYDTTFPRFAKIHVNGEKQSELFEYLKSVKGFQGFDENSQDAMFLQKQIAKIDPDFAKNSDIKWNFTKFLINRRGEVVKRYEPLSGMDEIERDVAAEL